MTVKIIPRYVNHLWYPILVPFSGANRIVEMQGKEVNAWNDMVRRQWKDDTAGYPKGWCV